MQTKTVQLFGKPRDRMLTEITAHEMRSHMPIFVPYMPEGEAPINDVAMAEYSRYITTTNRGQLVLWVNPTMPRNALQQCVAGVLSGERSAEGVWVLQGADRQGNLQLMPLANVR